MEIHSGFVVIGRYIPEKYKRTIRSNSRVRNTLLSITYEDFFNNFKGIEGDLWLASLGLTLPTEDGSLLGCENFDRALEFYIANKQNKCDLTFLRDVNDAIFPAAIEEDFSFCGFEVGIYSSIYSYWSCISNEIVNGTLSETKSFSSKLNNCFLFTRNEDAKEFLQMREQLCQQGHSGVELEQIEAVIDDGGCRIYEVYLYNK